MQQAYLFVHFREMCTPDGEQLRFALSRDGFTYQALNGDRPILSSQAISQTGGVRDPHILRGRNGWFYMVVTDMRSAWG